MNRVHIGSQDVQIELSNVVLEGILNIPENAEGFVIFVHGSGSSRLSPRNQFVAKDLNDGGLGTLLFDLLTPEEEQVDLRTRHLRFDIELLARRTTEAADWLMAQPEVQPQRIGFFGASTGAAGALITAAERPVITKAVVSRGGRPDLAGWALPRVVAPTLFLVGELDTTVIELNQQAIDQMDPRTEKQMEIVPGATHLFEEPGALEKVSKEARSWFRSHLGEGG